MAELKTVQSEHIEEIWQSVIPFIDRLVEYDEDVTLEGIKKDLLSKNKQLWLVTDGEIISVTLTQIFQNSKSKVCLIFGCSGDDMSNWVGFISAIENWAKSLGCDYTEIRGRKGWAKVLKHKGWVAEQVVIRKRHGKST